MFTRSNWIIGILLVIVLVGGIYIVVDKTDVLDGAFNNDTVETETELVCVENVGDYFTKVCADDLQDAMQVALGSSPEPAIRVTVYTEDEEVTTMSDRVMERFVAEEAEEEVVSTPVPSVDAEENNDVEESVENDNRNVITVGDDYPMFVGFPNSATPAYGTWSHEQTNTYVPDTGYMLGSPGVIGTHELDEANRNDSAVLITSNQHVLENETAVRPLPEGGYMMVSTSYVDMDFADFSLSLPAIPFHEYIVVLRGNYHADNQDMNVPVRFSNYNPGFIMVTSYDVPQDAGGFMSDLYVWQNVQNSFSGNCGLGDCTWVTLITVDVNSGSYSMVDYLPGSGWDLISTNVPVRYR